ncbi:MAG: hypothetical protein PWP10_3524 [Clostridiales bacterium]|jgi:CobQ-like glutamine amidotransferase family enzyme|nr:hypothetical protein [Clostridiales bacterium]
MKLKICHLYPDLLNLYGDRGNLITLERRCYWRGIECEIEPISIGQSFRHDAYDIVFMGGGQDHEQNLLFNDLFEHKGPQLRQAVESDVVFLCVCGGYQLLGHYYEEQNGERAEGLGIIDFHTKAEPGRIIGDIVAESDFLRSQQLDPILVGFENHAGRTWLGSGVQPLARVLKGGGNNGSDSTEGVIYRHTIGTYMHGSFLPKNPAMADWMISTALQRQGHNLQKLPEIDDELAENARKYIQTCK